MDPGGIAKKFCEVYYKVMQTSRAEIGKFYRANSTLTFQGKEFKGVAPITKQLNSIGSVQEKADDTTEFKHAVLVYRITKVDIQISKAKNSLCILLIGQLRIDGADPIGWTQFIHLTTDDGRQWYIFNDIFRLLVDWLYVLTPFNCSTAVARFRVNSLDALNLRLQWLSPL